MNYLDSAFVCRATRGNMRPWLQRNTLQDSSLPQKRRHSWKKDKKLSEKAQIEVNKQIAQSGPVFTIQQLIFMLPSVLKRGCDLQQSSSTASSQTTAQYLFIETRECTVNMKHFAKSQEITAISRPFGEPNHPRWNVSGLRIIRLETVIVHTAFSGFFWRAGRRGGGGQSRTSKVWLLSTESSQVPLANDRKLLLCSYCKEFILRVVEEEEEESRTSLHVTLTFPETVM